MKSTRREPAPGKRSRGSTAEFLGVAAVMAGLGLTFSMMGPPLAEIFLAVFVVISILLSILLSILRPRSMTAHEDWREVDGRRRARVWRAIHRMRKEEARRGR